MTCSMNRWAPDLPTLYLVQNRLYLAIRQVDPKHAIIFEDGYTGLDHMPTPEVVGWSNVMMSCHHYVFKASSEQQQSEACSWPYRRYGPEPGDTPLPAVLGRVQPGAARLAPS